MNFEDLPIAPTEITDAAILELEHLTRLLAGVSANDWSRPSAARGWTIGEVAAHLDLFVGLYGRFLGAVLAGGGSNGLAKVIGWVTGSVMPSATPVFDTINAVIPKALDRVLTPQAVKTQFAAGARNVRARLLQMGPDDFARPVYFEGGPYPLAFYVGIIVNELAMHAWDIESKIAQAADLSHQARRVLPWFYWGSTRLMLRRSSGISGTVQVFLTEPESAMWWSLRHASVTIGRELTPNPDAQIRGSSGSFVLALAGRINPVDAVDSLLNVEGNRNLAERFLGSWHLI